MEEEWRCFSWSMDGEAEDDESSRVSSSEFVRRGSILFPNILDTEDVVVQMGPIGSDRSDIWFWVYYRVK